MGNIGYGGSRSRRQAVTVLLILRSALQLKIERNGMSSLLALNRCLPLASQLVQKLSDSLGITVGVEILGGEIMKIS